MWRWCWTIAVGLAVLATSGRLAWAEGRSPSASSEGRGSVTRPGGAQLWAQNCARCHTMRSPTSYSDREWDLITHQMRVRANFTKEEYEAIREFLKSGK